MVKLLRPLLIIATLPLLTAQASAQAMPTVPSMSKTYWFLAVWRGDDPNVMIRESSLTRYETPDDCAKAMGIRPTAASYAQTICIPVTFSPAISVGPLQTVPEPEPKKK